MTGASVTTPSPEQDKPRVEAGKTLLVRAVRAGNRITLSASHWEALFGVGARPTPVWAGVTGEMLALERVGVGGGRKEVKARVCATLGSHTRVELTGNAVAALELRSVPGHGMPSQVGVAISGPKGALMLGEGVTRAAPRLILPSLVAQRLAVAHHATVVVVLPALLDPWDNTCRVEVLKDAREAVLVLEGAQADRLPDPGGSVTVRLQSPP